MDFRDFCIRTVIAWQAFLFTRKSQETKNSCNLVLTNQMNAYIIKKKGGVSLTTSSKIQEKILEYLSDGQNHSVQEMKHYLEQSGLDEYTEGQFAGSITTLQRNGSIKRIDRGIYMEKKSEPNMKKCFVVSPIGEEGSSTRINADKLFRHIIKPVCEKCDFEAIRVDQLDDAKSITQTIIELLETSELVIADISEHNPNVFFEIGFRTRTNKPIIHLKNKSETLPFDINTIRTFEYDLTDLDGVEEVKKRLINTIQSFNYQVDDQESDCMDSGERATPLDTMPILYQILDAISELKSEVRNINSETIGTVIKTMQNTQQQVSPDTALQMQLIGSLMQNPENFMKLIEISEKLPSSKK